MHAARLAAPPLSPQWRLGLSQSALPVSCTKMADGAACPAAQGFNRYPVLSIHVASATNTVRNSSVIARLTPTGTSPLP